MRALTLLSLLSLAAVPAAAADVIYKSIGPDGRVMYADAPAKGAVRVQRLALPPASVLSSSAGANAPLAETGTSAAAGPRTAIASRRTDAETLERLRGNDPALDRLRARDQALDRATAEIRAAASELERTEQRLAQAQEPLPGERTGLAGGGSRLNDFYFARLNALELQRAAAQRRLDAAYEQRNALKD